MPASTSLSEKVLLLETAFTRQRIPHAFGGAIALGYYGAPRGTIDIDVNVFVPVPRAEDVLEVLSTLGADRLPNPERQRLERDGQIRLRWEATPVDLFFAYDPFHASCHERLRRLPFGNDAHLHVLSPEDLLIFKAIFDRTKDWRDIEELVFALGDELDHAYIHTWLERILGPTDERTRRVAEMLQRTP